jgi:uncharacterized protein (DUF2249 family)
MMFVMEDGLARGQDPSDRPGGGNEALPMMNYDPEEAGVHFWVDEHDAARAHLDVRELLQEGGEPYAIIMECVQMISTGQRLVVHAIMQPRPLMNQLGRMGYSMEVRHVGTDHWELEVSAV